MVLNSRNTYADAHRILTAEMCIDNELARDVIFSNPDLIAKLSEINDSATENGRRIIRLRDSGVVINLQTVLEEYERQRLELFSNALFEEDVDLTKTGTKGGFFDFFNNPFVRIGTGIVCAAGLMLMSTAGYGFELSDHQDYINDKQRCMIEGDLDDGMVPLLDDVSYSLDAEQMDTLEKYADYVKKWLWEKQHVDADEDYILRITYEFNKAYGIDFYDAIKNGKIFIVPCIKQFGLIYTGILQEMADRLGEDGKQIKDEIIRLEKQIKRLNENGITRSEYVDRRIAELEKKIEGLQQFEKQPLDEFTPYILNLEQNINQLYTHIEELKELNIKNLEKYNEGIRGLEKKLEELKSLYEKGDARFDELDLKIKGLRGEIKALKDEIEDAVSEPQKPPVYKPGAAISGYISLGGRTSKDETVRVCGGINYDKVSINAAFSGGACSSQEFMVWIKPVRNLEVFVANTSAYFKNPLSRENIASYGLWFSPNKNFNIGICSVKGVTITGEKVIGSSDDTGYWVSLGLNSRIPVNLMYGYKEGENTYQGFFGNISPELLNKISMNSRFSLDMPFGEKEFLISDTDGFFFGYGSRDIQPRETDTGGSLGADGQNFTLGLGYNGLNFLAKHNHSRVTGVPVCRLPTGQEIQLPKVESKYNELGIYIAKEIYRRGITDLHLTGGYGRTETSVNDKIEIKDNFSLGAVLNILY